MGLKDVLNAPRGADNRVAGGVPEKSKPEISETHPEQVILAQSKEDLFLRQLMAESKNEPDAWHSGEVVVDEQFKSMFTLPVELRKGERQDSRAKENSYCWVEVSDERVARMYTHDGWIPVNRTNHAWLKRSYFSVHGGIERNGYSRHILFYQPRKFNEAVKMASVNRAKDRLESNKKKLENADGPVRLEEVTTSGGYGITPADEPFHTDWQGNEVTDPAVTD